MFVSLNITFRFVSFRFVEYNIFVSFRQMVKFPLKTILTSDF